MSPAELYDRDFYEWTLRNAELLRSGRASEADLDHHGVIAPSTETRLPIEDFLSTSPFSLEVLLDPNFLP